MSTPQLPGNGSIEPSFQPQGAYYQPPSPALQGGIPPGMFQQYHAFPYGYPMCPPIVAVIGYRDVPIEDPSNKGRFFLIQEPVYGYVYPHPVAPPQTYPLRTYTAPEKTEGKAPTAIETPPVAEKAPAAAAGTSVPQSETKDLKLSEDEVGLAVTPSSQKDERSAVEEFFKPKQADVFDHSTILQNYLAKTRTKDSSKYLPSRYQEKFDRLAAQTRPDFFAWEDAMLHHPPIEMLGALNRIQSIFTTFQSSPGLAALPRYLFPCSLTIPEDLKKRFSRLPKMQALLENKDRMVLEVTLFRNGKPAHVFLRPLKEGDQYRKKNFGENSEKIVQGIKDSEYPTLGSRVPSSSRVKSPTLNERVIETDTHLEFLSDHGVTIKALKNPSV